MCTLQECRGAWSQPIQFCSSRPSITLALIVSRGKSTTRTAMCSRDSTSQKSRFSWLIPQTVLVRPTCCNIICTIIVCPWCPWHKRTSTCPGGGFTAFLLKGVHWILLQSPLQNHFRLFKQWPPRKDTHLRVSGFPRADLQDSGRPWVELVD